MRPILIPTIALLLFSGCAGNSGSSATSSSAGPDTSVVKTARDAFGFALPLVLMQITKIKGTNLEAPVPGVGAPVNQVVHFTKFPDADFRDVVRPNADTYYNTASMDLGPEPLVLNLPDTKGRYYLMPILDAWTNIFSSPGSRTTGNKAGKYLITGPKWNGTVPAGMTRIKSPTNMAWMIGRVQVNSAEDGKNFVEPIQAQISLTPLSAYGKPYTAPKGVRRNDVDPASPNEQVEKLAIDSFFNMANQLMVENPPYAEDAPVLEAFAKIGVAPGAHFDITKFDTATQAALRAIPGEVIGKFKQARSIGSGSSVNGWSMTKGTGEFGTNYAYRALISYGGLGANINADAVYPGTGVDAEGKVLNGANKYVLHFNKGEEPPVKAFWSLTMYDQDGYFIHNPINRYAIGDRSKLKKNADGSLDIYFQKDSPGKDKESNWLPCPAGDFNLLLRMYWPDMSRMDKGWAPPAVKKAG